MKIVDLEVADVKYAISKDMSTEIRNLHYPQKYLLLNIGNEIVSLELEDPIIHYIMNNNLNQYVRCIDKTTVISRHDFKGGYNQ